MNEFDSSWARLNNVVLAEGWEPGLLYSDVAGYVAAEFPSADHAEVQRLTERVVTELIEEDLFELPDPFEQELAGPIQDRIATVLAMSRPWQVGEPAVDWALDPGPCAEEVGPAIQDRINREAGRWPT